MVNGITNGETIAERQKQVQQLHRELMLMRANYADLLDSLTKWYQRFTELYHKSDDILNGLRNNKC